jgi:tetratricopeptide (TPR) repeat protein
VLKSEPGWALAHDNLGVLFCLQGAHAEALESLRRAVELEPQSGPFRYDLAHALWALGEKRTSREEYARARELDPTWRSRAQQIAWARATHANPEIRNGAIALRLAEQLCEATDFRDAICLDTLAAAYAENGRFDLARATLELALALERPNSIFSAAMRDRLRLYSNDKPFRDVTSNRVSPSDAMR